MTREEALSILKSILADLQRGAKDTDNVSCCLEYGFITYGKAKDCIKALEQEPVLDKIRAEIEELIKCSYGTECLGANCPSNTDCMICGDHVLEIIDKYKAESEE